MIKMYTPQGNIVKVLPSKVVEMIINNKFTIGVQNV